MPLPFRRYRSDDPRWIRPAGGWPRPVTGQGRKPPQRRHQRRREPLIGVAALALLVAVASCTGADAVRAPGPATAVAAGQASSAGIPADDENAIRSALDRLNATAGGPVADQQKVLAELVDPGSVTVLRRCPPTTATLRFEPVYPALRSAPGWRPNSGALSGTVYALPVLIRIYTGNRITGTDLTTLHLGVANGEASLTALCVS